MKDLLDPKNAALDELPFLASDGEYEAAVGALLGRWTGLHEPPIAIFQIGEVGVPGVSDLDFIVVLRADRRLSIVDYLPSSFSQNIQRFYTHPPLFCTVDTWNDLAICFPVFRIRRLWGAEMLSPSAPSEYKIGIAVAQLVVFLIARMPRDVVELSSASVIRVRTLLCVMSSIKYTCALLESAGIPIPEKALSINTRIQELRRRAVAIRLSSSELHKVSLETIVAIEEVYAITAAYLAMGSSRMPVIAEFKPLCSFHQDWRSTNRKAVERAFAVKDQAVVWTVPPEFASVVETMARSSPAFARFVRSRQFRAVATVSQESIIHGVECYTKSVVRYRTCLARLGCLGAKYIGLGFDGAGIVEMGRRGLERFRQTGISWLNVRSAYRKLRESI